MCCVVTSARASAASARAVRVYVGTRRGAFDRRERFVACALVAGLQRLDVFKALRDRCFAAARVSLCESSLVCLNASTLARLLFTRAVVFGCAIIV